MTRERIFASGILITASFAPPCIGPQSDAHPAATQANGFACEEPAVRTAARTQRGHRSVDEPVLRPVAVEPFDPEPNRLISRGDVKKVEFKLHGQLAFTPCVERKAATRVEQRVFSALVGVP